MSEPVEQAQTPANSAVQDMSGKGSKQATEDKPGYLLEDRLQEICEKHYNQILPIMAEKVHKEKIQGVQTRLTYGESSRRNSQTQEETQLSELESCDRKRREKSKENGKKAEDTSHRQSARTEETCLSKNEYDQGGHWKSKSKKQRSTNEEDLSQPWLCEETDPFTARIPKEIHQGPRKNPSYQAKGRRVNGSLHEAIPNRSMHVNEAPECMRIFGFMHVITNPDLIKRLNDNISKSVDEMMSAITAFLWEKWPLRINLAESQNKNKFCEFHMDKGHSTDECIHLQKQIEEAVNSGQLLHLIKELKQGVEGGIVTLRNNTIMPGECRMMPEAPNMTSVLRSIAEHRLNTHEGCPPIRKKKEDVRRDVPGSRCKHKGKKSMSTKGRSSHETAFTKNIETKPKQKLASLSRFLSKSAEKSLPLFKTLKNCGDRNNA
nr:reverse transcriptase domain-containing protein [Tanacetum cinerariifolium]